MNDLTRYAGIPFLLTLLCLSLTACERDNYTTWSCKNFEGERLTMVLKKAQMQFHGIQFNYCGSLGTSSYFDLHCPAPIEDSSNVFVPSSGTLFYKSKQYQCDAL